MPGTYFQPLLHIVFSTKGRTPWITREVAERLYPYIGGIVRAEKGVLYNIGGIEDHVHMYMRWRPDGSVSDLMRTVKARSSKWIHDEFPTLRDFAWQEGYSVFSVSKSQEEAMKKYIAGHASITRRKTSSRNSFGYFALTGLSSTNSTCSIDGLRCSPIPLPLRGQSKNMRHSPRVALRP